MLGFQPAAKEPPAASKPGGVTNSESTLSVGDPAPKIDVDEWIKGDAVKAFEPGKVYVVEFWATWCGPCVRAIPHLTELQKKHTSVTFIGVAASERVAKGEPDKRLEKLKAFVENQGDKMGYRVAYDGDRGMTTPWLVAAGRSTIPTAFIVDHNSKVAWVGHPNKLDAELEKVLDAGSLRGKDVPSKDVKPSDDR